VKNRHTNTRTVTVDTNLGMDLGHGWEFWTNSGLKQRIFGLISR
jgi:hypothetical protein